MKYINILHFTIKLYVLYHDYPIFYTDIFILHQL